MKGFLIYGEEDERGKMKAGLFYGVSRLGLPIYSDLPSIIINCFDMNVGEYEYPFRPSLEVYVGFKGEWWNIILACIGKKLKLIIAPSDKWSKEEEERFNEWFEWLKYLCENIYKIYHLHDDVLDVLGDMIERLIHLEDIIRECVSGCLELGRVYLRELGFEAKGSVCLYTGYDDLFSDCISVNFSEKYAVLRFIHYRMRYIVSRFEVAKGGYERYVCPVCKSKRVCVRCTLQVEDGVFNMIDARDEIGYFVMYPVLKMRGWFGFGERRKFIDYNIPVVYGDEEEREDILKKIDYMLDMTFTLGVRLVEFKEEYVRRVREAEKEVRRGFGIV